MQTEGQGDPGIDIEAAATACDEDALSAVEMLEDWDHEGVAVG
jgi:hypothetical protein